MVGVAKLWKQKLVVISILIIIMVRQSKTKWNTLIQTDIMLPGHTWGFYVRNDSTVLGRLQFYGNADVKIHIYNKKLNISTYFYGNQTQGETLVINFQYKTPISTTCRFRVIIQNATNSGSYIMNFTTISPKKNQTATAYKQYHKDYPLKPAYIIVSQYSWPRKLKVMLNTQKLQQCQIRILSDDLEGQYIFKPNDSICLPQQSSHQWVYIVLNIPDLQLSQIVKSTIQSLSIYQDTDQSACCGAGKNWNQEILACIEEVEQKKYLSQRNYNISMSLDKLQAWNLVEVAKTYRKRIKQGYQSIGKHQFFLPPHIYKIRLQKGQKLTGYVDWNGELDIDIIIFRSGENLYDEEIQTQQFTNSTWQDFSFKAKSPGIYFIKIVARKLLPITIQYTLYYQTTITNIRQQLVGAFYKDSHNYSAFPIKTEFTNFKIICDINSSSKEYVPQILISKGDQQAVIINSSQQIIIEKKATENLLVLVSVPRNHTSPLSSLFLNKISAQFYIKPLDSPNELPDKVWKMKMIILCVALGFLILLTAGFIFYYVRNNNRRQVSKPYVNHQVQSRETQHKQHIFTQRQLNMQIPWNPQQS